ncbi:MAG: DUF255 domain-containing protein [Nevskia sp.]|nr:DUF255 domain-containing protein [Nevskia sp.]
MNTRTLLCRFGALLLFLTTAARAAEGGIHWNTVLDQSVFAQAQREHRLVLLDLQAVWCHWCHVMEQQTYADPQVAALIGDHFLAVKVDQDADPGLSNRYGDWGWPATIVFAPDGSELIKHRGFIPPQNMASLLQAVVDDPTPGPSVVADTPVVAAAGALTAQQRQRLERQFGEAYDAQHGGWGDGLRFVDAAALELALENAQSGDARAAGMARQTLDGNLRLIDPVWGGVYQYSEEPDWSAPHFEKIMSFQADDLRLYALAYERWQDPRYLQAAQAIRDYLLNFLRGPDDAFYVSQDADLSAAVTGHTYYALPDARRRALGLPRIDHHQYARENGWAIAALCRYGDASGDAAAVQAATRAAQWVLAHRALPGGGFRHDAQDRGGPYLGDTAAMGEAFLDLYRSTGDRAWLGHATAALEFIDHHFRDGDGGFDTAAAPPKAQGVFSRPVRLYEENVQVTRFANLAFRYSGDPRWRALAEQGMHYLAAPALADSSRFLPGVLLADREFAQEPVHITVVGPKQDATAQALHAAGLRYAADYLRVDWWDRAEGPLPNPDVQYPPLSRPAAFACTGEACSGPVFDPDKLGTTVDKLREAVTADRTGG